MTPKVVIIGVDGANSITGKKVLGDNTIYPFVSTIPPYTPPAWTSILTGVTPLKHKVFGWQRLDFSTNEISLVTSKDVKALRITEILDLAGKSSVMINLPLTYPFSGVNHKRRTIIVSDWASPVQSIYPKNLMEKYTEYLIEPPHTWWLNESKKDRIEYTKKIREYLEVRLNLYYSLLDSGTWDFYFVVFSEIDWISHMIPEILEGRFLGDVKKIFRLISKFIEYSKNISDVLFVVSDHGFEIKRKVFNVNVALREGGFLSSNTGVYNFLMNFGNRVLPKFVKGFIVKHVKSPTVSSLEAAIRDKATKAIMIEPATWGVYLRDSSIASDVIAHLKAYPEIKDVLPFENVYGGKKFFGAPDLFVIPEKGIEFSQNLSGSVEKDVYKADHEIHGIFYAWGEGILEDIPFKKLPTVYDIVPTVLFIMDLPIPNYIDGRVLKDIFDDGSIYSNRKMKYTDIRSNVINRIKFREVGRRIKGGKQHDI